MESGGTKEIRHGRGPHGATHPSWAFRSESAIWVDGQPALPNIVPLATEMWAWLSQQGHLSICTESERGKRGSITNPYTYHASTIAAAIAATINAAHDFSISEGQLQALDAEVERVRLQSELVLYTARFCEATIKQMLFCTQIPRRLYKDASLGQLLARDCDRCRKDGLPTHDVSLLGALAHQYWLCPVLEECVITHLQFIGRRRNQEAAHSDALILNIQTADHSRSELARTLKEVGEEFRHMVEHIGQIEHRMFAEIRLYLLHHPNMPPVNAFMDVPARPPQALIEQ